jgi:HKD family nuclease
MPGLITPDGSHLRNGVVDIIQRKLVVKVLADQYSNATDMWGS